MKRWYKAAESCINLKFLIQSDWNSLVSNSVSVRRHKSMRNRSSSVRAQSSTESSINTKYICDVLPPFVAYVKGYCTGASNVCKKVTKLFTTQMTDIKWILRTVSDKFANKLAESNFIAIVWYLPERGGMLICRFRNVNLDWSRCVKWYMYIKFACTRSGY